MDTTELQNQAIEIRDAENEGENTALRVGTMLLAIVDAFANIVDMDTLEQILTYYASIPGPGAPISWRNSRCLLLASMGAELDNVDGGNWAYTSHNGDIIFIPDSKSLRVVGEQGDWTVLPQVLYINAHSCHAYKWDSANRKMVEIADSNLPNVITYKNAPAFSQIAIGESYSYQSQSSGPKIAIKISSSETYSFPPDPKKIYAFRDIRQTMLWKSSNQTWVSLTPRVINDLTTGGEGDALSAEMGKQLNEKYRLVDHSTYDLAFSDDQGNIIVGLNDGQIKTKNFDSRQVATHTTAIQQLRSQISQQGSVQTDVVVKGDDDAALDFADTAGNVVLRVAKDGQIKTKAFDSAAMNVFKQMKLDKPQCVCHGYGAATGTSNTIPYFRNAVAKGYEAFEVDAVNCSDGIPVCTHSSQTYSVKRKSDSETVDIKFSEITSAELVEGYTWPDGEPIALLTEVIWYLCYVKRFPLFVDGQGMDSASRKYASDYAEEIGVGEYVFHFCNGSTSPIPTGVERLNMVLYPGSASDVQSMYLTYKKPNNNLMFSVYYKPEETIKAIADAAHALGCQTYTWTFSTAESVRQQLQLGADFIITSGIVNSQI